MARWVIALALSRITYAGGWRPVLDQEWAGAGAGAVALAAYGPIDPAQRFAASRPVYYLLTRLARSAHSPQSITVPYGLTRGDETIQPGRAAVRARLTPSGEQPNCTRNA